MKIVQEALLLFALFLALAIIGINHNANFDSTQTLNPHQPEGPNDAEPAPALDHFYVLLGYCAIGIDLAAIGFIGYWCYRLYSFVSLTRRSAVHYHQLFGQENLGVPNIGHGNQPIINEKKEDSTPTIGKFDTGECAICLESPQIDKCSPACGHTFCHEYLVQSYKTMRGCPSCRQAFTLIYHNNEWTKVIPGEQRIISLETRQDMLLIYSGSMQERIIAMADEREDLLSRLWLDLKPKQVIGKLLRIRLLDHGIVMFQRAYTNGQSVTEYKNARLFEVILEDYHDTRDTIRFAAHFLIVRFLQPLIVSILLYMEFE